MPTGLVSCAEAALRPAHGTGLTESREAPTTPCPPVRATELQATKGVQASFVLSLTFRIPECVGGAAPFKGGLTVSGERLPFVSFP